MTSKRNPYQAYSRASHTVAKTRQVVMLYDGIIRNLQQARDAMRENHIETRFNKLVRASEILIGLQMSLDFEQGAEAAQTLYDFYASLDTRIMHLHRSNDAVVCDALIDEIKDMRAVWDQIDRGQLETESAGEASSPDMPPLVAVPDMDATPQDDAASAEQAADQPVAIQPIIVSA